jgi:ABC-type molybdate transport system substrate-binding protein
LAVAPAMQNKGRVWMVPRSAYPKLEQAGVVLNWAEDRDAALAFCRFLQSERGQTILARHGFARK